MYGVLKKIYTFWGKSYSLVYSLLLAILGVKVGGNLYIRGLPHIISRTRGKVVIGDNCKIFSSQYSNPVGINHGCVIRTLLPDASISIGHDVGLSGATILARKNIIIGNHVLFGGNCTILDSDHHPLGPEERLNNHSKEIQSKSVVIGDNVWLGLNVIVLKGVTIGKNSVIAAGSVVVKDIPENVLAAGNPAKMIKPL